jgi:osmotically inducible protein OsmC
MTRKATAVWQGTGKEGKSHLTTQSTVLDQSQYSFKTRFEDGVGTNPEELIAAAHAGCFAMKLSFNLSGAGFPPTKLTVEGNVSLEDGTITKSHLVLVANVPNIDAAKFEELVKDAEVNCPISKLLKAAISVEFTLVP